MKLSESVSTRVDEAMQEWSQGDVALETGVGFVHLADLENAHSEQSMRLRKILTPAHLPSGATPVIDSAMAGFALVSQTCDVARDCRIRPFVEVAPLVAMGDDKMQEVRRLKRPAFAYVPGVADRGLVADLDRIMTVEKAVVASWSRVSGLRNDDERRGFGRALARKWSRTAFPDDFVQAAQGFRKRLVKQREKQNAEGAHLRALREIRVVAAPSWTESSVELTWWFIQAATPKGCSPDWSAVTRSWVSRIESNGRFRTVEVISCTLADMTARDYVESDGLDLDQLSVKPILADP